MSSLPLIITAEELSSLKNRIDLLILDLSDPTTYARGHIPGALYVNPEETQGGQVPAPGHLPGKEKLEGLIKRIGLRDDHHVVVYDDEGGGWAGRMIWLLNCVGFTNASLLSGGKAAWQSEGFAVTDETTTAPPGNYQIANNSKPSVTLGELTELVANRSVTIWDARSSAEFKGERHTAKRNGHIPGASHYEWTRAMEDNETKRIKDLDVIREELRSAGIDGAKEIVTHCQTHHRSGLTYLLGKALGFRIRAYPGSWSEWGNHPSAPVEK